jgi:DNA-binding beta-propeller fold protein YncE
MKKLATLVIGLFLLVGMSNAQNWKFDHLLYDFHLPQSNSWGVHGVAVAPDGNVWLALHGNLAQDTLFTPAGDTINLRPIYILDPATGQHVSGSPIEYLELPDGSVDTLTSSGKGIGLDKDGNILYVAGHTLYRIDYKTHKALNKWVAPEAKSLTEAAQANDGNIYITYVVPGGRPMFILDNNFNYVGNAIDSVKYILRSVVVTPEGKDIYTGSTWTGFGIPHFHSDAPGLAPFEPVDTLGNWYNVPGKTSDGRDTVFAVVKLWASCLDWGPNGLLWAGNLRPDWSGPKGGMWYAFDITTKKIVDSVGVPMGDSSAGGVYSPRGAAWSADGKTMYLADYDYNVVGVWKYQPSSVEKEEGTLPKKFQLSQNYPNPFNPTTTIKFSIPSRDFVSLKVYDLVGREVATLVNEQKEAGTYRVTFDARNLASGMYIYTLRTKNFSTSRKMILMK